MSIAAVSPNVFPPSIESMGYERFQLIQAVATLGRDFQGQCPMSALVMASFLNTNSSSRIRRKCLHPSLLTLPEVFRTFSEMTRLLGLANDDTVWNTTVTFDMVLSPKLNPSLLLELMWNNESMYLAVDAEWTMKRRRRICPFFSLTMYHH